MTDLNLARVESAVCATSSRNLSSGSYALDVCTALGFAGIKNVLGWNLIQLLNAPSMCEVRNVLDELAKQLARMRKIEYRPARDASWSALMWWWDSRCTECGGRGVLDKQQRQCPRCRGSGRRPVPVTTDHVKDAIGLLIEAETWMEKQLTTKLRGARNESNDGYRVHLPLKDSQSDHGFNHSPRTPIRATDNRGG